MRLARLVSPQGFVVLARLDGEMATPVAREGAGPRSDVLVDLLQRGVEVAALDPVGPPFTVSGGSWRAPVRHPGKVVAVGLNYADHAREASFDLPTAPLTFAKYPSSIIGHGEPICYRATDSAEVDYESELAVIIGTTTRDVSTEDALGAVFGYTLCNDVSARDAQFSDGQFTRGKSFDTFTPLGPAVVTADEIADPHDLDLSLRVNGEVKQKSNTRHMLFRIPRLIADITSGMTLEEGDIIATGSPSGVGAGLVPPQFLRPGDVVEATIEGIGTLINPVVAV